MLIFTMASKNQPILTVHVSQLAEQWEQVERGLTIVQNVLQVIHHSIYEYSVDMQDNPERLVRPEKGILLYSYETWQTLSVLIGYAQRAQESCRYLVEIDQEQPRNFFGIPHLDDNWASIVQMGKEVRNAI